MRPLLLSALLLTFAACGGPPAEDPTQAPTAPADTVVTPADVALARAQRLDERLAFGAAQTERFPAGPGQEPRVLRLWREGDRPVKLSVTESDAASRAGGVSEYYFDEVGNLFFVRHPDARYVLEGGQIVTWLDERLEPLEVPAPERSARAASVQEEARRYLAPFN